MVWAGEAGKDEAFIPLENGAVPVTMPGNKDIVEALKTLTEEFRNIAQTMSQNNQVDLSEETLRVLRNIESTARTSNNIQDKLLRATQN